MWDACDAHAREGVAPEPGWATDWDGAAQAAPDFELDQRINVWPGKTVTQTRCRVAMRPCILGSPLIPLVNSAVWRWIGLTAGTTKVSSWVDGNVKGHTWPDAVEMPIRLRGSVG